MSVVRGDSGRRAVTHYDVLETFHDTAGQVLVSLLKVELETGRTHQIRVHMADSGHPLLGDDVYGAGFKSRAKRLEVAAAQALEALNRQALHAAELAFVHPETDTEMAFRCPLPDDMQRLVTALEKTGFKSHS